MYFQNFNPQYLNIVILVIMYFFHYSLLDSGSFWAESLVPSVRLRVQVRVIDHRVRVQVLKNKDSSPPYTTDK